MVFSVENLIPILTVICDHHIGKHVSEQHREDSSLFLTLNGHCAPLTFGGRTMADEGKERQNEM